MPSWTRVSRRSPRRTSSTISRVRPRGLSYATPWKPSITCGSGRPEAQHGPAARHVVEARHRLEDGARRARVDVEDARPDLHPLGLRREVAHQRRRVEAVGLGDPDHVEPGSLQRGHLVGRLARVAGVHQRHRQLHASHCDSRAVTVATSGTGGDRACRTGGRAASAANLPYRWSSSERSEHAVPVVEQRAQRTCRTGGRAASAANLPYRWSSSERSERSVETTQPTTATSLLSAAATDVGGCCKGWRHPSTEGMPMPRNAKTQPHRTEVPLI